MRKGFTLLEVMVASLLLAMLVTALTMMFNQSSIAWRTGTAGVAQMNDVRTQLGAFDDIRDEALPNLKNDGEIAYRNVSLWQTCEQSQRDAAVGELRRGCRAYRAIDWSGEGVSRFGYGDAEDASAVTLASGGASGQDSSLFTVGVRSAGPNRTFGDEDDITTWSGEADGL